MPQLVFFIGCSVRLSSVPSQQVDTRAQKLSQATHSTASCGAEIQYTTGSSVSDFLRVRERCSCLPFHRRSVANESKGSTALPSPSCSSGQYRPGRRYGLFAMASSATDDGMVLWFIPGSMESIWSMAWCGHPELWFRIPGSILIRPRIEQHRNPPVASR